MLFDPTPSTKRSSRKLGIRRRKKRRRIRDEEKKKRRAIQYVCVK